MEKAKEAEAKAKKNSQPQFDLVMKLHGSSTVLVKCTIDQSLFNIIERLVEQYHIKRWTEE
jgi:hypothetical protein